MTEQEQIDMAVCPLQKKVVLQLSTRDSSKRNGTKTQTKMPFPLWTNRPVHPSFCSYMDAIRNSASTALIFYYWFVITFQ